MKTQAFAAAAVLCGLATAACTPVGLAVGTGAVIASSVAEERSTMDAISDTEIKVRIHNALLNHSRELFGDVSVDVTEGRVVLIGSVPKVDDKVEATRLAWTIAGVVSVDDSLEVANDTGARQYLEDVRISNTLRAALIADGKIRSVNYNVETLDRVVHLTGLARSAAELDRVIKHAREVRGVTKVVSHVLTIDDPRRLHPAVTTG